MAKNSTTSRDKSTTVAAPRFDLIDDRLLEDARHRAWLKRAITRGRVERFFEEVVVSPYLAAILLEQNEANRPISESRIKRYETIMMDGRWRLSVDGIAFDRAGRLINGQHRLKAIISAGVDIPFTLWFGREENEFEIIDQGLNRSSGNLLAIDGFDHYNHRAALAVLWHRISEKTTKIADAQRQLELARSMAEGDGDAMIKRSFSAGEKAKKIAAKSAAAFAYWYILRSTKHPEKLDVFWDNLTAGTTAGLVNARDTMQALRLRSMSTHDRAIKVVAVIIQAWNAWSNDKKIPKNLTWKQSIYLPQVV